MKKRLDDHRELLLEDGTTGSEQKWNSVERSSKQFVHFDHWPHVFNLANSIIGVSILAMPYCLQQCGILLGTVLIAVCSLLTKITCHLLYKGALLTRRRSYEGMALYAFGSRGRRVVEMLMVLFLMSAIVSFLVVIGDLGPHVVADYLQLEGPTQRLRILVMVLIFLSVILPLSLVRNYDSLSLISSVTIIFYFIFVARMLIESFPRIFEGRWSSFVYWWRIEGVLKSFPIISMALSCQTQLFCVADCIKDPAVAKMDTIVAGAVNLCSGIYAAVGLFGYVAFHDIDLHGDILLYLSSSFITQMIKLAFMLSVAVSIPLMLFPTRIACYNLFIRGNFGEFTVTKMSGMTFFLLTIIVLFSNLLIAIVVPNVEFILGLTGALIGSLVTIVIPSLLYITVTPSAYHSKDNMKLYAKISVLIGLLMLVGSTFTILRTERETNIFDEIMPKHKNVTKTNFPKFGHPEKAVDKETEATAEEQKPVPVSGSNDKEMDKRFGKIKKLLPSDLTDEKMDNQRKELVEEPLQVSSPHQIPRIEEIRETEKSSQALPLPKVEKIKKVEKPSRTPLSSHTSEGMVEKSITVPPKVLKSELEERGEGRNEKAKKVPSAPQVPNRVKMTQNPSETPREGTNEKKLEIPPQPSETIGKTQKPVKPPFKTTKTMEKTSQKIRISENNKTQNEEKEPAQKKTYDQNETNLKKSIEKKKILQPNVGTKTVFNDGTKQQRETVQPHVVDEKIVR